MRNDSTRIDGAAIPDWMDGQSVRDLLRILAVTPEPRLSEDARSSRTVERTGPPCAACGEKLPDGCVSDDFCDPVCQRAWAETQTDGYRPSGADAARVHSFDDTDSPELREATESGAVQHGGTLEDLATQTVDAIARGVNSQWTVELWRNSGDTLRFRVSCDHEDCDWSHDHDHEGRLTDRNESVCIRSAVLDKVREHRATHAPNYSKLTAHTRRFDGSLISPDLARTSWIEPMLRGLPPTFTAFDETISAEETPEETEAWNAACVGDGKRGSVRRRPTHSGGPRCSRPVLDSTNGHIMSCSRRHGHSGQHVACGLFEVYAVADNNESETP